MSPRLDVVVCGGGVAGVEAMLRLRRLADDRVRLTVVAPNTEFVYRPAAVGYSFALSPMRRYPLQRIAADVGARWVRDQLSSVDHPNRAVHTESGVALPYDALLLAIGAHESSPFEYAYCFNDRNPETIQEIVREIETGQVNSVTFVLPHDWVWPLPLYELALMTAERARVMNVKPQITFITAEARPLKAFGQAAGDAVVRLLHEAGIALHTGVAASVPSGGVVAFGDRELVAERIVTLPKITGPAIQGIPAGARWLVPIDERCTVLGTDGSVFAAGDATDFPVKLGGIGAQQADTAAAGIAHLAGVGGRPPALRPMIHGMLLTGGQPLYLSARLVGGLGWRSEIHVKPPWSAEEKIVAAELGPYLRTLDPERS